MDWVPKQSTGHKVGATELPAVAALGKELVVGVVDHVIGIIITQAAECITAEKSEINLSYNAKLLTIFSMSYKNSPMFLCNGEEVEPRAFLSCPLPVFLDIW